MEVEEKVKIVKWACGLTVVAAAAFVLPPILEHGEQYKKDKQEVSNGYCREQYQDALNAGRVQGFPLKDIHQNDFRDDNNPTCYAGTLTWPRKNSTALFSLSVRAAASAPSR